MRRTEFERENIEEMFVENGYKKREIQIAMKDMETRNEEREEPTVCGVVPMPNIPQFTTKFYNIARKHRFSMANKTTNKVSELSTNAKTPLGDKNSNVYVYSGEYTYTGETYRKWKTRRKEHENKVRLTHADLEAGNMEQANERMNESDGGLAKHSTECAEEIN